MVYNETDVLSYDSAGVHVKGPDGAEIALPADTVIQSNVVPDGRLEETLKAKCGQVIVIGDALKPRRASNALADGWKAGMDV